jgi:hypothetical protein
VILLSYLIKEIIGLSARANRGPFHRTPLGVQDQASIRINS